MLQRKINVFSWSMVAWIIVVSVPPRLAGQAFQITGLTSDGALSWSNAFPTGVVTLQSTPQLGQPWQPVQNIFTTAPTGQGWIATNLSAFHRLVALDISASSVGFAGLVHAYGVIETIAGNGAGTIDITNYWRPEFEGGPATAAALSRPHFAQGDAAGNIYIVDKDSHSILKVTTGGRIYTVAGTHVGGFNGDGPASATSLQLNNPNGLWVRPDGVLYILDTDNGRVRRVGTNGVMTTLVAVSGAISVGRGLWVADDESLIYFCAGTSVKKWTAGTGVKTFSNGYTDLGNIVVRPDGDLVVTDRGANLVYVLSKKGVPTIIAGNGSTSGGGDGQPALQTGLNQVRGVWFLPNGGYLFATHAGSQVWYVDTQGIIHLFVDGLPNAHAGDGQWFYSKIPKVSECRSVAVDPSGNILIVENDGGYVRRIRFVPLSAAW
jgi:hypothetical protein